MFTRCLFCHRPFAGNDVLEHMPRAEQVAFDPRLGRLWAVCRACGRWNLVPLAERWEAVEELERLSRGRARLIGRTDEVALLAAPGLDVVRVGRAPLREEAWWRYGRSLLRHAGRSRALRGLAAAAELALAVATHGILPYDVRRRRFGRAAWRGRSTCPRCGHVLTSLSFAQSWRVTLVPAPTGVLALEYGCSRCGWDDDGAHLITGVEAEHALRRILAYHHVAGAGEREIQGATDAIDRIGSPEKVVERLAAESAFVGGLVRGDPTRALALEISLGQSTESAWLKLELTAWEARWREEETIAAIVDRELTPVDGLESLGAPAGGSGITPSAGPTDDGAPT